MIRTAAALVAAGCFVLTGCGGEDAADSGSASAASDDRGRAALKEVTSLEGSSATAKEQDFVDEVIDGLSRPYWDSGPEAMVLGYEICVAGTPSAAVFDLVDRDWSQDDAEVFVDAATEHLC